MQDRRFPSIDPSAMAVVRTHASPSVDERLLPTGLSHDAAAAAPWIARRSTVCGPRVSLAAAGEKTSSSDDDTTRCCSCRLCRNALRRLLVITRFFV